MIVCEGASMGSPSPAKPRMQRAICSTLNGPWLAKPRLRASYSPPRMASRVSSQKAPTPGESRRMLPFEHSCTPRRAFGSPPVQGSPKTSFSPSP